MSDFMIENGILMKYIGTDDDVIIPNSVTQIGLMAFYDCTSLISISIPDSVTIIDRSAFEGCTSLTSISIPASVTEIGDWVFGRCTALTSISIPDSVTEIGEWVFAGCTALISILIPASVTTIGHAAFEGCTSLTSISIPSNVTQIDWDVFCGCTSLKEIRVVHDNPEYCEIDGVLFSKDGKMLCIYPDGLAEPYTIPDGVSEIGDYAFSPYASLTSISIPASVTQIAEWSFCCYKNLTIHAPMNSYAEQYAKKSNIRFKPVLWKNEYREKKVTNMGLNETKFNELFNRWKQEYHFDAFISDGIVDGDNYADPHILFVLRDMNCREEHDLCADLRRDGSGWETWNNVGRWTTALLDGATTYPFDMSTAKRVEQLKRIAVMNVKKEGGGHRAISAELVTAVREQASFIRQEISLCSPKLIVCCGLSAGSFKGNAVLLKDFVFESSSEWMTFNSSLEGRKWWYYYTEISENKVPVISFCHPQVTVLGPSRGHENLFMPLYQDMLTIRNMFLQGREG